MVSAMIYTLVQTNIAGIILKFISAYFPVMAKKEHVWNNDNKYLGEGLSLQIQIKTVLPDPAKV